MSTVKIRLPDGTWQEIGGGAATPGAWPAWVFREYSDSFETLDADRWSGAGATLSDPPGQMVLTPSLVYFTVAGERAYRAHAYIAMKLDPTPVAPYAPWFSADGVVDKVDYAQATISVAVTGSTMLVRLIYGAEHPWPGVVLYSGAYDNATDPYVRIAWDDNAIPHVDTSPDGTTWALVVAAERYFPFDLAGVSFFGGHTSPYAGGMLVDDFRTGFYELIY